MSYLAIAVYSLTLLVDLRKFQYTLYLGYDVGDRLLDSDPGRAQLQVRCLVARCGGLCCVVPNTLVFATASAGVVRQGRSWTATDPEAF